MSTIGAVGSARGFSVERAVVRVGRALVAWGERREQAEVGRQHLYRRQIEAENAAARRAAAVRGGLLP
jgi:hypothetical protein